MLEVMDAVIKQGDIIAISVVPIGFYPIQHWNLVTALKSLASHRNASIVFVMDYPQLKGKLGECRLHKSPTNCSVRRADSVETMKWLSEFYDASFKDVPRLHIHDYFCKDEVCDMFIPGTHIQAYRDPYHIDMNGAAYLRPFICSSLHDLGLI